MGRVRSAKSKRIKTTEWNRRAYPTVDLYIGGGRDRVSAVHRLVAEAFLGACPAGHEVNHKDGDRANARADNLEYLTHSENVKHAYRTGLYSKKPGPKGPIETAWVAHPRKLDVDAVRLIRKMAESFTLREIAAEFHLHRASVWAIVSRKRWAHLP
jgi:hypothetical protein